MGGDGLSLSGLSNASCLWAQLPSVVQQRASGRSDLDPVCGRAASLAAGAVEAGRLPWHPGVAGGVHSTVAARIPFSASLYPACWEHGAHTASAVTPRGLAWQQSHAQCSHLVTDQYERLKAGPSAPRDTALRGPPWLQRTGGPAQAVLRGITALLPTASPLRADPRALLREHPTLRPLPQVCFPDIPAASRGSRFPRTRAEPAGRLS